MPNSKQVRKMTGRTAKSAYRFTDKAGSHLERKLGRNEAAMAAYQRALEVKPGLDEAREALSEMQAK